MKTNLNQKKYSWIKFLIELEAYKNSNNKLFKKAIDYLKYLKRNKEIRDTYALREIDELNCIYALSMYCKQKYEEEFKEGYEKSFKKRIEIKMEDKKFSIHSGLLLLKLKKYSLDKIKELSDLLEKDINIINNFLNNPNPNIKKLTIDLNFDENDLIKFCNKKDIYYVEKEEINNI
eukprot:jgi/Orpsp1_1/1186295/evm.model.d7180000049504.1